MGRPRRMLLATIILPLVTTCSSQPSAKPIDAAGVYIAVVTWFSDRSSSDPQPLPVFVEPRGQGTSFGLNVQASVIKATGAFAEVKFIDSLPEAVKETDGVATVRGGGILLALGPVVSEAAAVVVQCDELSGTGDVVSTITFDVALRGTSWTVVSAR